jgi:hypothetical protein
MRFCIFLFIVFGCSNKYQSSSNKKDWEQLYAHELNSALDNEDDLAFYFFWPYYLQARYENKLKKLEKSD